ncbi:TRAP transporter substrate-binding protein [Marinobacterium lutimaris]|uniref:TRAP-type C4-dicarboxylate transport system, substrate-binding protein n=1 Tax=Marinobacterium lutimaris TaxID=568106 RepID=A0A1H5V985_9GAMM|nr:TRAP transporter substrate-binding protein [Marinobacterium lutimaris]SEF83780.1 TRAP-type C4-dicarboxylate transport system, substrate-binding protein [Marinobacterium lutimaris]
MLKKVLLPLVITGLSCAAQADTINLRVLGQPSGSGLIAQQKEQPFFEQLAEKTGLDIKVEYLPVDVAGIPDTDGLRVLRSGLFDIVSLRGPQVSRDEPSILGLDLVGLNTSYAAGKKHMDAFSGYVGERIDSQFNAKLLGVWPAGPQVVFCKPSIQGLADLQGLKVRVGDQSAANFVDKLGATGISMPFGEVQQSLARGVVDCAITGPASANSGGWPEATTTVLPVALQLAVNGYAINSNTWAKFTPEQQEKLASAISELNDDIWAFSEELYQDAMHCNTGSPDCKRGKPYSLTEATVAESDLATVAQAVGEVSLPIWAKQCNAVAADCEETWRKTVGTQLGL